MLHKKMTQIIEEVNAGLAERNELVHTIALALLTGKNLFVLGKPGQAKSMAIDLFRQHIHGAKQFDILMNKGTDQEQLFGRLDLASIIPGHISHSKLHHDKRYQEMTQALSQNLVAMENDPTNPVHQTTAYECQTAMEKYRKCLAELYGGVPEILTDSKIPDSHICFLDEIFKSNDGVLNSLLKALNERVYTNEGITISIPTISFFSASNEIPNFSNPEEKSLEALYDRFDFKVITRNVEEKANRMRVLADKAKRDKRPIVVTITLDELYTIQEEVQQILVPDNIFELADTILCELRRKDITVSDRTYFNFAPVVKAEAWLAGRTTVLPVDMRALTNYLWNKPEEYNVVQEVIRTLIENPLGDQLNDILAGVYTARDTFNTTADKTKALLKFRQALIKAYDRLQQLHAGVPNGDTALSAIDSTVLTIEEVSRQIHETTAFTYVSMEEIKSLGQ